MSSDTSRILTDPFAVKNPLTVQVLGICSALAVTSQLEPSLIMGLSVTAVICVGNVVVSLIRKMIPNKLK